MWEEIESTHASVYTTYGIQRHVKNPRSIPRIDDGSEEVGNLNSSVLKDGRNLNVLRRWRVNSVHTLPSYFFKIRFNNILSSTSVSSRWSLSFYFLCQNLVQCALLYLPVSTTCPPTSPSLISSPERFGSKRARFFISLNEQTTHSLKFK